MTSPLRGLWDAPAASPRPPRRVWRDWVLVGVIPPLVFVEAALRPEVPSRWLWAAALAAMAPVLLWRRSRPFTALAVAFAVGSVISLVAGGDPQLYTTAYILILLYALARWGRGRAVLAGIAIVATGTLMTLLTTTPSLSDAIGGIAVAAMTIMLGLALRWRAGERERELGRVRLLEREQLARDLHDTVAHHVSAIAIQAQAGLAVAPTRPDAATGALRVIESEASRTLDEMRAIVRALRNDDGGTAGTAGDAAELAPMPGIPELRRLADPADTDGSADLADADDPAGAARPRVDVRIDGDIESVPPTIAAALFRIAQEAVTNARRHARGATRVDVNVGVDDAGVRLDVRDDGEPAASASAAGPRGYGLTGMSERAVLLGGTCSAGPAPEGGWRVAARLPRAGWST